MTRTRAYGVTLVGAAMIAALLLPQTSVGQEATLGTITPTDALFTWNGPWDGPEIDESHRFNFSVDMPESYWDAHDLVIEIKWEDRINNFDLYLHRADGSQIAQKNLVGSAHERIVVSELDPGDYFVKVYSLSVLTPRDDGFAYLGLVALQPPPRAQVIFDNSDPVEFAPASIVSANFLGSEPQLSMERPIAGSQANRIDPDRLFVDWPLTTRSQIGQVARSTDGGDSFRLLVDLTCAARSRPTCQSGGGGDTDTAVSSFDGDLFFSDQQGGSAHTAIARSTDHGDSFPSQDAITNTTFVTDRQWLAPSTHGDDALTLDDERRIEAFLSTRVVGVGMYIQGIDQHGEPILQPRPQLRNIVAENGPLRVDTTGASKGWLYMPYDESVPDTDLHLLKVATAPGSEYQDPAAWRTAAVATDDPILFPWLDIDKAGNAYMVWAAEDGDETAIFFSSSPIDHEDNLPPGGRPGTYWTNPARITPPEIGSAVFPAITAGDPGRVAVTYMGTEDHRGLADEIPLPSVARWYTHAAVITNALASGGAPVVSTGLVSHRVAHEGQICTQGFHCEVIGGDRSLLDLMDVSHDHHGRASVVFMDNHSTFARPASAAQSGFPFVHFAKQVSGPSLRNDRPSVDVEIPEAARPDPTNDATWPNSSGGRHLPTLDLKEASVFVEGDDLVARVPLVSGSRDLMKLDLASYNAEPATTPPAGRLQHVVRFSDDSDVYHMSVETLADGSRAFFGGKLGENDALDNGFDVFGSGYHRDPAMRVSGEISDDAISLRAPMSDFGLSAGDRLFSVTGFAMAGPAEAQEETIFHLMRTVDATPPYDMTLVDTPDPSPTPTPTGSAIPVDASIVISPGESTGVPGTSQVVIASVTDPAGRPLAGVPVTWDSGGVGAIDSSDATTDDSGQATATLSSSERGDQIVTASLSCADGPCTATTVRHWGPDFCDVFGTDDSDLLESADEGEVLCGFGGNDTLLTAEAGIAWGGDGNDRLFGSIAAEILRGGRGDDELRGRRGRDRLRGGRGDDLALGGPGRDFIRSGRGHDVVRGGPGRDECRAKLGRDERSGCER